MLAAAARETRWLVEPKIESLVAALRDAASDRARLRKMGLAARRKAESEFVARAKYEVLSGIIHRLTTKNRERQ